MLHRRCSFVCSPCSCFSFSPDQDSEQIVSILLTIFLIFGVGCLLMKDLCFSQVRVVNQERDLVRACCLLSNEGAESVTRRALRSRVLMAYPPCADVCVSRWQGARTSGSGCGYASLFSVP